MNLPKNIELVSYKSTQCLLPRCFLYRFDPVTQSFKKIIPLKAIIGDDIDNLFYKVEDLKKSRVGIDTLLGLNVDDITTVEEVLKNVANSNIKLLPVEIVPTNSDLSKSNLGKIPGTIDANIHIITKNKDGDWRLRPIINGNTIKEILNASINGRANCFYLTSELTGDGMEVKTDDGTAWFPFAENSITLEEAIGYISGKKEAQERILQRNL